jgi:hypothetical protein
MESNRRSAVTLIEINVTGPQIETIGRCRFLSTAAQTPEPASKAFPLKMFQKTAILTNR